MRIKKNAARASQLPPSLDATINIIDTISPHEILSTVFQSLIVWILATVDTDHVSCPFQTIILEKQISQSNSLWKYNLIPWGHLESMKKEGMGAYFSLVLKRFLSFLHNTSFLGHKKKYPYLTQLCDQSKCTWISCLTLIASINIKPPAAPIQYGIKKYFWTLAWMRSLNIIILLGEILGVGDVHRL